MMADWPRMPDALATAGSGMSAIGKKSGNK